MRRGGTGFGLRASTYPFGSLLDQALASHGQLGIVREEYVLHGHVAREMNGAGGDGRRGGGHD